MHTAQQVYTRWKESKNLVLIQYYDAQPGGGYDGTFNLTYEVRIEDWRYHVEAHVHVEWGGKTFNGNTFIPGLADSETPTPDFVVMKAPTYDADTHGKTWCSQTKTRDKVFAGDYRYPQQVVAA